MLRTDSIHVEGHSDLRKEANSLACGCCLLKVSVVFSYLGNTLKQHAPTMEFKSNMRDNQHMVNELQLHLEEEYELRI